MIKSIRLLLFAMAAAAGISAYQGTTYAIGSTELITICFRGNNLQIPYYLRNRYYAAGAYNGPCVVSGP